MKQELIIFSLFKWSDKLMHREHMIARSFQKMGYRVTFAERSYLKPHEILNQHLRRRVEDGVEVLTVPTLPYLKGKIPAVYGYNDKILEKALSAVLHEKDQSAWLFVTNPNWAKAVVEARQAHQMLAYDMSDDFAAFATNDKWKNMLQNYEDILVENADALFVTTKALIPKVKATKEVFVIENGVDLDDFSGAQPILRKQFKNPLAGYIGGIFDWVDLDLIKKAALLNPTIDFIMIGPTNKVKEVRKLAKMTNVHYLGEVSWKNIPDYFASLDAGLLPFVSEKKYPRLKSANSNKLYQYAYFGYPIIATDFSQVRGLHDIVTVCASKEDFAISVGHVKVKNSQCAKQRKDFAKDHDWKTQAGKIAAVLNKV